MIRKTRATLFDDFLTDSISSNSWALGVGTDPQANNPAHVALIGGAVRLTTGDVGGGDVAVDGSQLSGGLYWRANTGGLAMEFRVKMSAITDVMVYAGFTDQKAALELPFTLSVLTLTSNASNAVGFLFDTDATNDKWHLVGVKADVDVTMQNTAIAPVAATYETFRVEVSSAGAGMFYRNGILLNSGSTAISNCVTSSTPLCPVVVAISRTTSSRTVDLDYVLTQSYRT